MGKQGWHITILNAVKNALKASLPPRLTFVATYTYTTSCERMSKKIGGP